MALESLIIKHEARIDIRYSGRARYRLGNRSCPAMGHPGLTGDMLELLQRRDGYGGQHRFGQRPWRNVSGEHPAQSQRA
jgi:hypothetical protein